MRRYTETGRIVYERKTHFFKWKDLNRILNALGDNESPWDRLEKALDAIRNVLMRSTFDGIIMGFEAHMKNMMKSLGLSPEQLASPRGFLKDLRKSVTEKNLFLADLIAITKNFHDIIEKYVKEEKE